MEATMSKDKHVIRLKYLRDVRGWTQQELSGKFGFNDRQTLASIEAGDRKLSAEELVKAAAIFEVSLDQFTNPFLISGEGRFSWRQSDLDTGTLLEFETQASEWIGMYRELSLRLGEKFSAVLPRLPLNLDNSYEDAALAGERLAEQLELGPIPAGALLEQVESKLETLVLLVDMSEGISGAAIQIPEFNVVLINRREPSYRRNFNLGHELFHVLTWESLPPEHLDGSSTSRKQTRIEQMANSFASGLLMPSYLLNDQGKASGDLAGWLNNRASELQVSAVALKWRLHNVGLLSKEEIARIDDDSLRFNGAESSGEDVPSSYSARFIRTICAAIENGEVSAKQVSRVLNLNLDDLNDLIYSHGLDYTIGL
jgi:Zn-dependent peptidase ImmA (M78 family)/DNA-binding XRE family transcriptional regulator